MSLDVARIEHDFAALCATGWPPPAKPSQQAGGLFVLLVQMNMGMAQQMLRSSVPETRAFWRARFGLPAEVAA